MIIPSAPISAFIQLTPQCNNACPGCSNLFFDRNSGRENVPPSLRPDEWKRILLKLKPFVTRLRITGGEPTLYPALEEVLSAIAELQIPFALFTNGRWKEPKRLLAFLKENQFFRGMLVSLHGATPEAHEAFSGIPGSFEETVDSIKLALGAGIGIHTNTVITRQNYDQIEKVYNFARTLGVPEIVIARYVGKAVSDIDHTADQLKHAVRTVEKMIRKGAHVKHNGCIPKCFVQSGAYGCAAAYTFFTIDPWGNIYPCNHAPIRCGNLLEQSVTEIWNSEPMRRWRDLVPAECKSCSAYSSCHGGCHAAAMAYERIADPLMAKPFVKCPTHVPPQEKITLSKTARPLMRCQIRPESFGYLLVRDTQSAPVSWEAKAIMDACDGSVTLEEILERFGQSGLNLVGALVKRDFIELSDY
jgi:radical SAM protein with 4Fe4S-binding SPASM domain